ncbi:MAG: hypothetical protein AAB393_16540 [Bacteroidota bacterium]
MFISGSTSLVRQFEAAPPGKLYCLHGSKEVFRLSLHAAAHALLRDVPITIVDGSNRFDLYYMAEFARNLAGKHISRKRITPEQLLENIFISRAFTCYQMEAVITDRLPAFVQKKHSPVVLIFGLLDTFYDEQAPLFEVKASVERIINALHQLKQQNISVLLASMDMKLESKERNQLFPRVASAMDSVMGVVEEAEGVRLVPDSNFIIRHSRFDIQYSQRALSGGPHHG